MTDRSTQLTLGVFVATGLYSALILRVVEDSENSLSAPHLSVTIALLFAVFAIAMLIHFIHHIAVLIQAPEITDNVRREVASSIDRIYPERVGLAPPVDTENYSRDILESLGRDFSEIYSENAGYVQAVESDSLFETANQENIKLELLLKPGSFVAVGDVWAKTWGACDKEQEERIHKSLKSSVILGNRRTPLQDVQCSLDELVEVAVRSLSPGINDPFTAINCIDWLGDSLARLVRRELPSPYRYDESGTLRIILSRDSFEEMSVSVFSQIQPYSTDNFEVTIRLLKNIHRVALASDSKLVKRSLFGVSRLIVESIEIPLGDLEKKRLAQIRAQMSETTQDKDEKKH